MKKCELYKIPTRTYCESDEARLCWECDAKNQRWSIRDGNGAAFWTDRWGNLPLPLCQYASVDIDEVTRQRTVASYRSESGGWRSSDFEHYFDHNTLIRVMSEMPPNPLRGSDKICWGVGGDGNFTVKKAYFSIEKQDRIGRNWNWMWKMNIPERVKLFMWQMLHLKLPTNARCSKWSDKSDCCVWCCNHIEDTIHVLRDCQHAMKAWRNLVHPSKLALFVGCDFDNWIALNRKTDFGLRDGIEWTQVWAVGMWMIWHWRNKACFEENFQRPFKPHMRILEFVKEIDDAACSILDHQDNVARKEVLVAWEKPPKGWVKLNSDGAVKGSDGNAGCGAIIRDHNGSWVAGVVRSLWECSVLKSEAWGMFEPIHLALSLNLKRIVVEADSKCLVDGILKGRNINFEVSGIIDEIFILLQQFDEWKVQHKWREGNNCVDFLANLGASCNAPRLILNHPPSGLENLLRADALGIQVFRLAAL
ncbi:ribonuclease H [Senna tora]|uniref:Ribonuclease H n=1 Tax=Senna tora TaxID=362788 RepID=A0A834TUB9_9FABA|nr:ribonuclease H [Senna tora]